MSNPEERLRQMAEQLEAQRQLQEQRQQEQAVQQRAEMRQRVQDRRFGVKSSLSTGCGDGWL